VFFPTLEAEGRRELVYASCDAFMLHIDKAAGNFAGAETIGPS
jgi:hypothetical protein